MSARIGNYIGIVRKVYQEVLSGQSITVSVQVDNNGQWHAPSISVGPLSQPHQLSPFTVAYD